MLILSISLVGLQGCNDQAKKESISVTMNDIIDTPLQSDVFPITPNQQKRNKHSHGEHSLSDTVAQIEPVSCHNMAVVSYFEQNLSDKQVKVCGSITKILPTKKDAQGVTYQQFIMQLDGVTPEFKILVKHNIDVAEPLVDLHPQDTVMLYGVYEYDAQGGYIHSTHHKLSTHQHCGWIEYKGNRYQ